MLKFMSLVALLVTAVSHGAVAEEGATSSSDFQNIFKKVKEAGSNIDFSKLSAGAMKAQETFGPLISKFKDATKPVIDDVEKKLADTGLVPTTTSNPMGSVLKNLQFVGIGSNVDVAKVQENTKKAQDTLGPLFNQFSSFLNKKSSSGVSQQQVPVGNAHPLDQFIIEDSPSAAAAPAAPAAPTVTVAAPAAPSNSNNLENTFNKIKDASSKIDFAQVQEGAKKIGSFFSQFNKNSGAQ